MARDPNFDYKTEWGFDPEDPTMAPPNSKWDWNSNGGAGGWVTTGAAAPAGPTTGGGTGGQDLTAGVNSLYGELLGRQAEDSALTNARGYWGDTLDTGEASTLRNQILGSEEYKNLLARKSTPTAPSAPTAPAGPTAAVQPNGQGVNLPQYGSDIISQLTAVLNRQQEQNR